MENEQDRRREWEHFDAQIEQDGSFDPFTEAGWLRFSEAFSKLVSVPPRPRLLDIGCGTGSSRRIYAPWNPVYCGLDLSARALVKASLDSRGVTALSWLRGDATALPFAESSLDVVAFSSVLHHLPDSFEHALAEAFRVLRPGGVVLAYDPNLRHPAMALFRHPKSPFYDPRGVSPNERPLLPSDLRRRFASVGFTAIRQRVLAGVPFRAVAPDGLNRALAAYNVADRLLALSGLGHLIGPFVLTCGWKR